LPAKEGIVGRWAAIERMQERKNSGKGSMMVIIKEFACDFSRAAVAVSLALALGSCSALDSRTDERAGHYMPPSNPYSGRKIIFAEKDGPEVLRYEYRPSLGFVRIERIETGAPDNAHPFEISIDALRHQLASVKLKDDPIFTGEELDEVVPYLAAALTKAAPNEDVTFAVTGRHGLFGKISPKTVTTGRVFARDQRLNVVFGVIHDPFDIALQASDVLQPFAPGTRAKRIETRLALTPGIGRLAADDRPDWVTFDTARTEHPPAAAPARTGGSASDGPMPSPKVDSRPEEIERRLRLLDRLKERGVITEEEYRDRRRAILQEL
jgi:hypothetical protein